MPLFIAAPFIAIGCFCFVVCAIVPGWRSFALPASLFCIASMSIVFAEIAAIILITVGMAELGSLIHSSPFGMDSKLRNTSLWGWLTFAISILIMLGRATIITLLHGWLIRRMTFFLFRFYATTVSVGVGFLTGLILAGLSLAKIVALKITLSVAVIECLACIAFLAYITYQNATQFRGSYPEKFAFTTREEYSD